MAPTQTPRAAEHDAAKARADELAAQRGHLATQHEDAQATLDRLHAERADLSAERGLVLLDAVTDRSQVARADQLRTKIEELDRQIRDAVDFSAAAEQRLAELSQLHAESYAAHQVALRELRREPCETKLQRVSAALRAVESAWTDAATEARLLEQQGDIFGQNELYRLGAAYFKPHITEGPYSVRFPDRSAL